MNNNIKNLIKKIEISLAKNNIDAAIQALKSLIKYEPNNYLAFCELGNCFSKKNDFNNAMKYYQASIDINNKNIIAINNQGIIFLYRNKFNEAINNFKKVIEIDSEYQEAYINLGAAYDSVGFHLENINISLVAISKWPSNPILHLNLGAALSGLNLYEEAKKSFETCLILNPELIEAKLNIAAIHSKNNLCKEAINIYEEFLIKFDKLNHSKKEMVKYYLSYEYLKDGNLKKGWEYYLSGFDYNIPSYLRRRPNRDFDVPMLTDSFTLDHKILIWSEQGLGDELMFATMLPDLLKNTSNIIFECDSRLVPIFSRTYPKIQVREHSYIKKELIQDYDFHMPSGNLCLSLRFELKKFPINSFNLVVDPLKVFKFQNRLLSYKNKKIIGISWRSQTLTPQRNVGYTSLTDWGSVLNLEDCIFVNLQYGDCETEIKDAENKFNINIIRWNDLDLKNDLEDVLALITCLDLVITPANAVSSLAGSVGKETFMFVNKYGWDSLGTDYCPWFSSIKIFKAPNEEITASVLKVISNYI